MGRLFCGCSCCAEATVASVALMALLHWGQYPMSVCICGNTGHTPAFFPLQTFNRQPLWHCAVQELHPVSCAGALHLFCYLGFLCLWRGLRKGFAVYSNNTDIAMLKSVNVSHQSQTRRK